MVSNKPRRDLTSLSHANPQGAEKIKTVAAGGVAPVRIVWFFGGPAIGLIRNAEVVRGPW